MTEHEASSSHAQGKHGRLRVSFLEGGSCASALQRRCWRRSSGKRTGKTSHPVRSCGAAWPWGCRGSRRLPASGGENSREYDRAGPCPDARDAINRTRAIAVAQVKTDSIDATTLSHMLRADLIPRSHIPGAKTRRLREMARQRLYLVRLRTMIKNRIHTLEHRVQVDRTFQKRIGTIQALIRKGREPRIAKKQA